MWIVFLLKIILYVKSIIQKYKNMNFQYQQSIIFYKYRKMETQTYLTDIQISRQNQSNSQKFTRFNYNQINRTSNQSQMLKKQKFHHITSTTNNINSLLPEQYYSVKKIKPGIAFYKTILEGEEKRKINPNIPILKINISNTLLFNQNSLQLIYSDEGVVKIKSQMNFYQFLKMIKIEKQKQKQEIQQQDNYVYAAALTGVGGGIQSDFSVTLSNQIDLRVLPRNQNQFSVQFIQPYGDIPNILRLFYKPKSIKNSKPNYAYKAINKKKITQQINEKKHKLIYNYIVDFNKQNLIMNTLVKGKALLQVEEMTQSIIDYIQSVKQIKITQIVVDYICGNDRLYYFHEVKSIKSINLTNAWHIKSDSTQFTLQYKQQTTQIACRLCGFAYPKNQISKNVTNKLILQLLTHLHNRGQTILQNTCNIYKCNNIDLSGISSVCDLCYQLIVAQHKLIDVQRIFLDMVNMGIDDIVRVRQITNRQLQVEQKMNNNMVQWRLFLYVQRIKNLPYKIYGQEDNYTLNMKFNDVKQTFIHKSNNIQVNPLSRLNSATSKTTIQNKSSARYTSSRTQKKSTQHTTYTNRSNYQPYKQYAQINIQKIKIITFYTQSYDISQILQNQQLIFQLSCQDQVQKYKYKGNSSTLQNFCNRKECQRHSFQVLLFDTQFHYSNLEVSVGLVCDGMVSIKGLDVRQASNGRLWYLQKNGGNICSPLPTQWMQIITQGLPLQQLSTNKPTQHQNIHNLNSIQRYAIDSKSIRSRKIVNKLKNEQKQQQQQQNNKNQKNTTINKLDLMGLSIFF